ncbi:MAG: hypothetical protein EPO08_06675 [Rhodospirillaceae bacterium]|nr:MAG: hypothetical protein EPO08_06675 [Rhodospirillaceae bacterium]
MEQPSMWVAHALVWPTFIVLSVGLFLRPVKTGLIALQCRHREHSEEVFETIKSPLP